MNQENKYQCLSPSQERILGQNEINVGVFNSDVEVEKPKNTYQYLIQEEVTGNVPSEYQCLAGFKRDQQSIPVPECQEI